MDRVRELALTDDRTRSDVGDLDQILENAEALLARLQKVSNKLGYLYGDDTAGLSGAKPKSAGRITQIQALVSDLADELGLIEQVIERL